LLNTPSLPPTHSTPTAPAALTARPVGPTSAIAPDELIAYVGEKGQSGAGTGDFPALLEATTADASGELSLSDRTLSEPQVSGRFGLHFASTDAPLHASPKAKPSLGEGAVAGKNLNVLGGKVLPEAGTALPPISSVLGQAPRAESSVVEATDLTAGPPANQALLAALTKDETRPTSQSAEWTDEVPAARALPANASVAARLGPTLGHH